MDRTIRESVDGHPPRRPQRGARGAAAWADHNAHCAAIIQCLANTPAGVTGAELTTALKMAHSTAHTHIRKQVDAGKIHMRVGLGLIGRSVRYFTDAAAADAWRDDLDKVPLRPVKPAPVKKPQRLPQVEIRACQPVVTLRPAASGARAVGDAIITDKTKFTIDTTQRPTARWQLIQEAPDERWPSYAAGKPGTDPETGRAWA